MSDEPVFFIKAYLWAKSENWSQEQVDELMNRFADFLNENGFENPPKDTAKAVNTIIVAGQEYHPDNAKDFFEAITTCENGDITMIMIPAPDGDEKKEL